MMPRPRAATSATITPGCTSNPLSASTAPESLPGNVEFEGYIARLVDAKGKTVQTVAKEITVRVEGTASGATKQTRFGSAGAVVVAAELYPVVEATMTGTPVVGSKLTAKALAWTTSGVKLSYQWHADGAKISKATNNTFTLTSKQQGRHVTVQVVAKKAGYLNGEAVSEPVVVLGKQSPVKPKIAGTAKVGEILTVSDAGWAPAPVTLTVQWYRDGLAIAGATGFEYTAVARDLGKRLTVP